ncbi:hypothetical protein [Streptomyces sp. UNOC14_S4]|uniref:hypothetical protein n=1 Tax=Streptomyces sp. UNOC14_S4 TaxID=2872340 RepID=UPI001E43DCD7|nr:hypothetical protein [Streptomyces sp. UNOC14_S4]
MTDHVPGAGLVKGAANGVLGAVGSVSPQARRAAAYAGIGVLGVVGLVEWPVAAAGAAVVWLTQQRPAHDSGTEEAPEATSGATSLSEQDSSKARGSKAQGSKTQGGTNPRKARGAKDGTAEAPPPDDSAS